MTRLRQTVARRLKEAQDTAALLTTFNDCDMSAVIEAREKFKGVFEKKHGVKLGFMSFFAKAACLALKDIPAVNARIEGDEKLRAFAALVLDDCFLIGDLRVVEGEDGYFVAMPSKRKRDGSFKDIAYPLNNDIRLAIEEKVLLAYEAATGNRAISRIEQGAASIVRPDLLSVEEFSFTPKPNPN